jgi:predicted PurR-regulated permease PerM
MFAVSRGYAVAILCVLAIVFALYAAQAVFIPLVLGVLLSYALSPLVNRLQRWHVPRAIGAALLLIALLGGAGLGGYSLRDNAMTLIDTLPQATRNFRLILRREGLSAPGGVMYRMQQAATHLQRDALEAGGGGPALRAGVTRVQIDDASLDLRDFFWMGTRGAVTAAGQAVAVLFLVFFLLVSGDTFRRKLVKITGTSLKTQRLTTEMLDEINAQIQRFLLVQIATSTLVGLLSWLTFLWIGLDNAAIWGVAAALCHTIPYLGPAVISGGTALVALLQFGTIKMSIVASGLSLLIASLVGLLLMPWLTGRTSRLSPIVVFVGLLFWGWLWGVWGLLLGLPILMATKAICDRADELKPVGELLGA